MFPPGDSSSFFTITLYNGKIVPLGEGGDQRPLT